MQAETTDLSDQIARLSVELRASGAAAILLSSPADVCYATGFEVPPAIDAGAEFAGGPALALVTAAGHSHLLFPNAYTARAERMSRAAETTPLPTFGHFYAVDAGAEFLEALARALAGAGLGDGTLALDRRTLPASVAELLRTRFSATPLVDGTGISAAARRIKTPRELELVRRAVAAVDAGQEALLELARPGANELELWAAVVGRIEASAGHETPVVGELVSGPRTSVVSYPGGPVDRTLERGDTVLMDISARVDGYWADCCNTLVAGAAPDDEQLLHYRAAHDAFDAAVAELRPGRRACDAYAAAEAAFVRHGLRSTHYAGHQVGASVNEGPRLVPYDTTPIEAGMVFAVEPGTYAGEGGRTGARTEKVVLVTTDGPEVLSSFRFGMDLH